MSVEQLQGESDEPLEKAEPEFVRRVTGYVIGGFHLLVFPEPLGQWIIWRKFCSYKKVGLFRRLAINPSDIGCSANLNKPNRLFDNKRMPRAERRAHDRRMKNRARRTMRLWAGRRQETFDPRQVGLNASAHCRPCACWMCQGQRTEIFKPRERAVESF